jgi:hypothetical protein
MARAQLHHTRQVDERHVRREPATGGMHRHRDHGMGTPKSSAQRRNEWPRELHLRAPSFGKHVRHLRRNARACFSAENNRRTQGLAYLVDFWRLHHGTHP